MPLRRLHDTDPEKPGIQPLESEISYFQRLADTDPLALQAEMAKYDQASKMGMVAALLHGKVPEGAAPVSVNSPFEAKDVAKYRKPVEVALHAQVDSACAKSESVPLVLAFDRWDKIDGTYSDITSAGAYAAGLASLRAMCPGQNLANAPAYDPTVTGSHIPSFTDWPGQGQMLFHTDAGICATGAGELAVARQQYEAALKIAMNAGNFLRISTLHQNLTELELYAGNFDQAAEHARAAIKFGQSARLVRHDKVNDKDPLPDAFACLGMAELRRGHLDAAMAAFACAEAQLPAGQALGDMWGLWHAETMLAYVNAHPGLGSEERAEYCNKAERIIAGTYADAKRAVASPPDQRKLPSIPTISQCERLLGDLAVARYESKKATDPKAAETLRQEAAKHYDRAVAIADATTAYHMLAEALLARGRFCCGIGCKRERGVEDLQRIKTLADEGHAFLWAQGQALMALEESATRDRK